MPETGTKRPVWSGTLAFGLVTLPVEMHSTVRRSSAGLRMVDEDGTPLSRRYFSEADASILDDDEIVRGFELEEGEFVLVEDEELDELDAERSRTMTLESFVPREQLDPLLVENTYLLVPREEALPAYRLLVASMADSGRAGMASFVMRERSYDVALVSDSGTLRAVTLRYPDEVRSVQDIGLPDLPEPDPADVELLQKAMENLKSESLDTAQLQDHEAGRLEKLVKRKLKSGKDTSRLPAAEQEDEAGDESDLEDIMVLLRRSLEAGGASSSGSVQA